VPDRLLVDLGDDGQAEVLVWPDGGRSEPVSRAPLAWPLDAGALEDLRWYLENYLRAPFGVWGDRGPTVQGKLAGWSASPALAISKIHRPQKSLSARVGHLPEREIVPPRRRVGAEVPEPETKLQVARSQLDAEIAKAP